MIERFGFGAIIIIGMFTGLNICNLSDSTPTVTETVEVQDSSVLPGYAACISPEHIPDDNKAYDQNLCMDTALLQGYPFDVDAISHTTLMVNFHLEDDQTAILYVSTDAIVGM